MTLKKSEEKGTGIQPRFDLHFEIPEQYKEIARHAETPQRTEYSNSKQQKNLNKKKETEKLSQNQI